METTPFRGCHPPTKADGGPTRLEGSIITAETTEATEGKHWEEPSGTMYVVDDGHGEGTPSPGDQIYLDRESERWMGSMPENYATSPVPSAPLYEGRDYDDAASSSSWDATAMRGDLEGHQLPLRPTAVSRTWAGRRPDRPRRAGSGDTPATTSARCSAG